MSDAPVPSGSMYLYDAITPPLYDGAYHFNVTSDVTIDGTSEGLNSSAYFRIDGPRFTLPPTTVAGVYPPRNGHGSFQESLPQIVLNRRTLPWERPLDPSHLIAAPTPVEGVSPPQGALPWLALLLFDDDEYTLPQGVPLDQVVPADVFHRLGSPAGITCDCVETTASVLTDILPSLEEIQLLTHVRQVSIEDRELSAGSSDGWFSVVMSNRLPQSGAKQRACLVSLEERSDIISANPPPFREQLRSREMFAGTALGIGGAQPPDSGDGDGGDGGADGATAVAGGFESGRLLVRGNVLSSIDRAGSAVNRVGGIKLFDPAVRLVLLHSWQFVCDGPGTFRDLMQGLDDGMTGKVAVSGKPVVSDTGHIPIVLNDRAGVTETVWYRGPLVPWQLTRDPLGPYHSADQARRVTPDTGAEDVAYAAAFEIGRLLAAADARLAQELMRWRRNAYDESALADSMAAILTRFALTIPPELVANLNSAFVTAVTAGALQRYTQASLPMADVYGLRAASNAAGLNPAALAAAWNLSSASEARALLGGDPGILGATVPAVPRTLSSPRSIDAVATDGGALARLRGARAVQIDNARQVAEAASVPP
jgi:hypothetical protein